MLICIECGELFEKEQKMIERHGLDAPPYEERMGCPRCGGVDIHPTERCDICGDWITGGYVRTVNGERICEECYTRHDVNED